MASTTSRDVAKAASALPVALLATLVACSASNEAVYGNGVGGSRNAGGSSGAVGSAGASGGGTAGTTGGAAGSAGTAGTSGASAGTAAGGSSTGGSSGTSSGTGGTGADAGTTTHPTSCSDIGAEPVIPPSCATVTATKGTSSGAPTSESLDSALIQDAINGCTAGQSVRLVTSAANTAFVSGPLTLKSGVTLFIDAGVTLFASRNPADYDVTAGRCGGNNTGSSACRPLIQATGVGSAVMGSGTIDGRGGEPVTGTSTSWWDLEQSYGGKLAAPRLIQTTSGSNFTLYGITLKNAPKFHVVIDGTNGFKVWGITIDTPASSPNTDGVDPSGATNGLFAYNRISTGDDNIAIKGSGPLVDNIIVAHNHFGTGHGMSIGSETYGGVRNVQVCDLSLDGTGNGLRIKSDSSRGGLVENVSYTGVCMRGVSHPFVFDPYYTSATGTQIPDYKAISLHDVHVLGGGSSTVQGYDSAHKLVISFDNVIFDSSSATFDAAQADVTFGPGPVSFTLSGTGVTVTNNVTDNSVAPLDCSNAW